MSAQLDSPLTTPSGVVFPNRLVKAAMAEAMSVASDPGDRYVSAYRTWSEGEWGGLLTGNVDVSTVYMGASGQPGNIAIKGSNPNAATQKAWKTWATAAQANNTPAIVQIVHPGKQSPLGAGTHSFFTKTISPSPIPLKIGDSYLNRAFTSLVFGIPREMDLNDIEDVIDLFVQAAKQVYEAGFRGVQLHGAHGYLLSQFLSPKSNVRTDDYGGTPAKRTRIVLETLRRIHRIVPATFSVGIKLNSADVGGAESLEDSLEQTALIVNEGIDFLEISGGTYENFRMAAGDAPDPRAARTAKREAFFLDYARAVREKFPSLVLMVTGGFRSRKGMQEALDSGACDLIGIGRPGVVFPHFPKDIILNREIKDEDAKLELELAKPPRLLAWFGIKLINAGADTTFYNKQIQEMADGRTPVAPGQV